MTTPTGARIMVVDDEPGIARAVRMNLRRHGFEVQVAETAAAALADYERWRPDLLLLDLGLPDADGLEVIRAIRSRASTPIIVLSVREAERDKVAALNAGADDYLTKPFGVDELLARVRVALRHVARPTVGAAALILAGDLSIDLEHRRVTLAGGDIRLTPTEYDLLKVLVTHPDRVVTERALLHEVWGAAYATELHYLHVYIARLRKKIEADPQQPRHLITEPGVGYRFLSTPIEADPGDR